MTFHIIPAIWMDDWGVEVSECIEVANRGAKLFCDFPREVFVKG